MGKGDPSGPKAVRLSLEKGRNEIGKRKAECFSVVFFSLSPFSTSTSNSLAKKKTLIIIQIANRQKQKGLQRLRWYCQMCSKQCRDENGFKCHLSSESHARQMALFGDAPAAVVDEFSRQFEEAWLDHMRRAHPTTRVRADLVYNELIQHRDHVHMNATRWHTLTEFVAHLGKSGLCKVDEDERGLHVTLAAADARVAGAEEARLKRAKLAAEAEARRSAALAAQAERARAEEVRLLGFDAAARARGGELNRKEGDAPVRLSVAVGGGGGGGGGGGSNGAAAAAALAPIFSETAAVTTATTTPAENAAAAQRRPKSKLELLMEQEKAAKRKREEAEEQGAAAAAAAAVAAVAAAAAAAAATAAGAASATAAEKKQRADERGNAPVVAAAVVPASDAPWLSRGLVVKIMAPELKQSGHYKRKAAVVSVVGEDGGGGGGRGSSPSSPPPLGFVGELETLDEDRDVLRVDQAQLETVLPGVGGIVRVVSCSATNEVNRMKKKKGKAEGAGEGEKGTEGDVSRFVGREGKLSEVDAARYRARVSFEAIKKGSGGGESESEKEREWFEYEDICKVVPVP